LVRRELRKGIAHDRDCVLHRKRALNIGARQNTHDDLLADILAQFSALCKS
jgi:hypothetical protein